jgi:arylsulfatase A-like enzyme
VSFIDLAPTFLDLAGAPPIESSPGRSLRDVFNGGQSGRNNPARSHVLIGRERNDVGRPNDVGYPVRGIVQDGWIYLENSEPTRWPAGNPETGYLDTDGSPTKTFILQNHRTTPADLPWQMCFGFRPERELYRLDADPDCILNLATHIEHAARMESLRSQLWSELKTQGDLRALGRGNEFEAFPSADKANAHFYERYLRGETLRAGWVDQGDFEKIP